MLQPLKQRILPWSLGLILALGSFLGISNVTYAQPIASSDDAPKLATASAIDLFHAAYDRRYTWDEKFPGYSAEVSVKYDKGLYHGLVRVNPDLSVAVINVDSEPVRQLVASQLQMEVTHRRRVPFKVIHGQRTFELERVDKTGAAQIREVGDEAKSYYKVQNQKITQVNRVLGDVAAHYQSIFCNPQTGEVLEKDDVRDFHEKIGKYYLLTNRAIRSVGQTGNLDQDQGVDTLIRFNDVQPLPKTSA